VQKNWRANRCSFIYLTTVEYGLKELIVAIQRGAVLATGCRACGSPFFSNIDLTGGSTRGAMKRKLEEANSLSIAFRWRGVG